MQYSIDLEWFLKLYFTESRFLKPLPTQKKFYNIEIWEDFFSHFKSLWSWKSPPRFSFPIPIFCLGPDLVARPSIKNFGPRWNFSRPGKKIWINKTELNVSANFFLDSFSGDLVSFHRFANKKKLRPRVEERGKILIAENAIIISWWLMMLFSFQRKRCFINGLTGACATKL